MHLLHTTLTSGWHWGTWKQFYDSRDVPQLNHSLMSEQRPTNHDWVMSKLAIYDDDDKYLPQLWNINEALIQNIIFLRLI